MKSIKTIFLTRACSNMWQEWTAQVLSVKMNNRLKVVTYLCICLMNLFNGFGQETKTNKALVSFDLNFSRAPTLEPITITKGKYIRLNKVPSYKRKGYKFAGWHVSKNPKLINGVSTDEWIFDQRVVDMMRSFDTSKLPHTMPIKKSMTLYARWVKPSKIFNVNDLKKMQEDLYGWYVLQNDIDLKNINWNPVGAYHHSYEFSNANWWQKAFRGTFNGNNYKIVNLNIKKQSNTSGLFAAVSNANIKNVTLKNYLIKFILEDSKNIKANFLYVSPLIGFLQGNTVVDNCHTSGLVNVSIIDKNSDMTFASVAGIAAAAWAGEITNCTVKGKLKISTESKNGGEIHIGGIVGEGYNTTVNCSANVKLVCNATSLAISASTENDKHLEIFAGGLHGASTYVMNSVSNGSIDVSLVKLKGKNAINIGGISGSERYGFIENCLSNTDLKIDKGSNINVGGIIGSFSNVYGMIGLATGVKRFEALNCLATGKVSFKNKNIRKFNTVKQGAIVSFLPKEIKSDYLPNKKVSVDYKAENCAYIDYENTKQLSNNATRISKKKFKNVLQEYTLKTILGSGWFYPKSALPFPIKRIKWEL